VPDDLAQLDVFYGDLTVNRGYVYARLPRPADDAGLSLHGEVRGPRCLHAETLPLTSPLVDLGPGPTLLARALLPEPCFWSPDLPAIYDVTVTLQRGSEIVATARREIGLRSLGVRGRHFFLEGKRWVLRGVYDQSTDAALPRAWHDAAAAYVTSEGNDDGLAEASQWGALAVVELQGNVESIATRLRQLAWQPAAALAVVRGELPSGLALGTIAPNVLLVQPISHSGEEVQPWAKALWAETSDSAALERWTKIADLPLVAVRRLSQPLPLDQARAACDQLQRDLAPLGQFAGYVV
jgi:hypothetical protein